ncbi:hypothetical protein NQ315_016152, partial [Exocentrus adspersus]
MALAEMTGKYQVTGMLIFFGTPLLDIIAKVDNDLLKKYNLKPDNAVRATPELESIFTEILNYDPILQPGGSVTNSARVFQWVSRKSYPMIFVGTIGDDEYGKMIRNKFSEEGIRFYLAEIKHKTTGMCAVLLTEDNRSLVTHLGASEFFSFNDADKELWEDEMTAKYLYLSAFLIRANLKSMKDLITHYLERDNFIILNLAASFVCNKYPNEINYLFKNSSMVFGNESEYVAFAKLFDIPTADLKDMLIKINKSFCNNPTRILIMTRGSKSVIVLNNDVAEEFPTERIDEEKIVDTNGAGDAFVGGFLTQFVKGKTIPECVKCGMWAAEEVIQNHGCNFDNKK